MPEPKPLRVGFDATSLLGARTGVGHVTAQMLTVLARRGDLDVRCFAITWRKKREFEVVIPPGASAATRFIPARLARGLWPRFGRPRAEAWTGPIDVLHGPNFVAPPSAAPVLVTVHDLTFARFPELCSASTLSFDRLLRGALDRGAVVHTYSAFVREEVLSHFALQPDRVRVVPPGVASIPTGDPHRGMHLAQAARYVVALGTIEPRKNLPRLVQAFDAVASRQSDLALVVAGPEGWGLDAFEAAWKAARHRDRIHRLGYVNHKDRADLLEGATALAYPSVYEGFGHPPLEAMQRNVPVVASSGGALPEVLGDAALLPDPDDTDALACALEQVVTDDALRTTLVARGHELTRRYRWDTTAVRMTELYRELARVS